MQVEDLNADPKQKSQRNSVTSSVPILISFIAQLLLAIAERAAVGKWVEK